MTSVSKARVQDITQVSMRKNKCIEQCYKRDLSRIEKDGWEEQAGDVVDSIRVCK